MQKWRNVGAVSAASIALYCCHSGALFSATVICPQEILRIIQGKEKNFLRRATQNAATPSHPLGVLVPAKCRGEKVISDRGTEVVKSVY